MAPLSNNHDKSKKKEAAEDRLLDQLIAENKRLAEKEQAKELRLKEQLAPPWEIRATLHKGQGMFATKRIKQGSEILRECAMIIGGYPWLSKEALLSLIPEEKRIAFKNLGSRCTCGKGFDKCTELLDSRIWESNAFSVTSAGSKGQTVLYEYAARINHACSPNATHKFTKKVSHIVVRASKTIKKGEEITINYGGIGGPVEVRANFLEEKFGFKCECTACLSNNDLPYVKIEDNEVRAAAMVEEGGIGTEIINPRNQGHILAERQVKAWLDELAKACNTLAKLKMLTTFELIKLDQGDAKDVVADALKASLKVWKNRIRGGDEFRGSDKFGVGEEVVKSYMDRLDIVFIGAMQSLKEGTNPQLALASFWCEINRSVTYEYLGGETNTLHTLLWDKEMDLDWILKTSLKESAAPKESTVSKDS